MLLIVVDEKTVLEKKKKYSNEFLKIPWKSPFDETNRIFTTSSLKDALNFIKTNRGGQELSIIINFILIDQVLENIDELKEFVKEFHGIIILKVDQKNELLAIQLMKDGLITEYSISTGDDEHDSATLQKAFKLAISKKNFNLSSLKFEQTLDKMQEGKIG